MKLENNNFTIYEVEEIKKDFSKLLEEDKVVLDLENITKVDMSAMQLLIALKKSCEESKKEFEIKNLKQEVLSSFEITGIAYVLGV